MRPSLRIFLAVCEVSLAVLAFFFVACAVFPQAASNGAATAPTAQPDKKVPKITSFEPSSFAAGRSIALKIRGTDLNVLKGQTINLVRGGTSLPVHLDQCADDTDVSKSLCGNLNVPPRTPTGDYSISLPQGLFAYDSSAVLSALSGPLPRVTSAELEKDYVPCPTDPQGYKASVSNASPGGSSGGTLDQITCSQSLLSRNEAADIFGKRVANTYLVVQVDVRNLSDDFQFLLHDVRLTYASQAVAGREKRLVRGVSEKGQAFDVRNLVVRSIQGSGAVLGGISALSFASTAFKDGTNIYQGPFAGAIQSIFPDFTIGQLNRLNDMAFGVQTIVIPKRSSVAFVSFLPQQVFLNDEERKMLKTAWYSPKQPKGNMLPIQQHLSVEIAGAHVAEVQTLTPTLTALMPFEVNAQDTNVVFMLTGTNLDKVASLRISQPSISLPDSTVKQASASKDLRISLPTHDPKLATTDKTDISAILSSLASGAQKEAGAAPSTANASVDYSVSLQTILGESIPTTLKLTVKGAAAAPAPSNKPAVTAARTADSAKASFITVPAAKASPLTVAVAFTGTDLDQIKSFSPPNDTACPAADVDKEVSVEIPTATTDPKSLSAKMKITDKAQAKSPGKVNLCAVLKDGNSLKLLISNFEIKAPASH